MKPEILNIIVCPSCKLKLALVNDKKDLLCKAEGYLFSIEDDIPMLLIDKAKKLTLSKVEELIS
jgi:uncharacterized protein YbaR (Trm112 family)